MNPMLTEMPDRILKLMILAPFFRINNLHHSEETSGYGDLHVAHRTENPLSLPTSTPSRKPMFHIFPPLSGASEVLPSDRLTTGTWSFHLINRDVRSYKQC